jgi:hypothetical protein
VAQQSRGWDGHVNHKWSDAVAARTLQRDDERAGMSRDGEGANSPLNIALTPARAALYRWEIVLPGLLLPAKHAFACSLARIIHEARIFSREIARKARIIYRIWDLANQPNALPSATAAMTEDTPLPFDLPAVDRKKITVDFAGGNQSSDGGLL